MNDKQRDLWETWWPRTRDLTLFATGIAGIIHEASGSRDLTIMLFFAGLAAAPVPLRLDAGRRSDG